MCVHIKYRASRWLLAAVGIALYATLIVGAVMSKAKTIAHAEPVDQELIFLSPHPQQNNLFAPPSQQEIERLADDIVRNGPRQPIEILPDRTIIRGHSRVLAAKHAGLEVLPAIIRHDLAEGGEAAVLKALAEDNLNRRHLSPLEIAKSVAVIMGNDITKASGRNLSRAMSRLQTQIAEQFGISRKTLQRYGKILQTPLSVQHAVAKDYLPMDIALQVERQPKDRQEEVAAVIDEVIEVYGDDADQLPKVMRAAVLEALGSAHKQRRAYKPVAKLVNALRAALQDFKDQGSMKDAQRRQWAEQRAVLLKGQRLISKLIKQIDELNKQAA
jgi:hypothetical protein